MSRRRDLSAEEHALWDGFVRSITPLRAAKFTPSTKPSPRPSPKPAVARPMPRIAAFHEAPAARPLPLAPFDRRLKQRVARGRDAIDARIDLHGMTQSQAHGALVRFLRRAQADGHRIVLIVTGKGSRSSAAHALHEGSGRGVLRRQVPLWLALPEFRALIVGFEEAHVSHGGEGAIYVRLRRAR